MSLLISTKFGRSLTRRLLAPGRRESAALAPILKFEFHPFRALPDCPVGGGGTRGGIGGGWNALRGGTRARRFLSPPTCHGSICWHFPPWRHRWRRRGPAENTKMKANQGKTQAGLKCVFQLANLRVCGGNNAFKNQGKTKKRGLENREKSGKSEMKNLWQPC